jgi:hypothetical protein
MAAAVQGHAETRHPCGSLTGPQPLPPPELSRTIERAKSAIAHRDPDSLRAIMAADVRISLGPSEGLAGLSLDATSPAWPRLEKALAIGCAPAAPSDDAVWMCPGLDTSISGLEPREQVFILGEGVPLRTDPDGNTPILARLSCRIVAFDNDAWSRMSPEHLEELDREQGWTPVIVEGGVKGYVQSEVAFRPDGYRVGFERRDGQWRIVAFLAGD